MDMIFIKYNTLSGHRSLGDNQCGMNLHCCNANGPRGMLTVPQVAVMASDEGPVVNLYCTGKTTISLPSGNRVRIVQETDYPLNGTVRISVHPQRPERFTLRLRVATMERRDFDLSRRRENIHYQSRHLRLRGKTME